MSVSPSWSISPALATDQPKPACSIATGGASVRSNRPSWPYDLLNVGTGVSRSQANAALGLGSDLQNLVQSQANVASAGILGQNQIAADATAQRQGLATTLLSTAFSDPILKTNKKVIGWRNGFTIWSWDWNALANALGLFGRGEGVMANEVKRKRPEAITMSRGYMMVNYPMIGV